MECSQVREKLELLALRELSDVEAAQVQEHLAGCSACAGEYQVYTDITQNLKQSHVTCQLAGTSAARIMGAVSNEMRGQRRRRLWLAPSVLAMAAALAMAVAAVWFARRLIDRKVWAGVRVAEAVVDTSGAFWQLAGTRAESTTVAGAPAVSAGRVYALKSSSRGDVVAAVSLADGRPLWTSGTPVRGYLAADPERVYGVSDDPLSQGHLVALDAVTGEQRWTFVPGGAREWPTTPQVTAGRVLWVAGDVLYAVDAWRGTEVWAHRSGGAGAVSAPCVVLDRVFVATGGEVVSLDASRGVPLWRVPLSPQPSSFYRPTISFGDNRLYVADRGADMRGTVSCFDPVTGSALWQRQGLVVAHAAACDGMLYVRGSRITAIDAASGATVWEREAAGCSPLFCVFGRLVFADASRPQALTVVEAASGRAMAEVALVNSCSGFTMVGSVGLVNTNDGVLHAVSAQRVLQRGIAL